MNQSLTYIGKDFAPTVPVLKSTHGRGVGREKVIEN